MHQNRFYLTGLFFILAFCTVVNGQTINGIVNDETNSPISYVTVILCNVTDTTQVDYSITDLDGKFSLKAVADKEYLLHVSYVGHKSQYLKAKNNQVILLEQDVMVLNEIVVEGTRPISKITASGVQTTVANTVLSDMGTGNDVLKRIPMVKGDNGNFEVFGKGKAKIYINNREVRDASEIDNLNSKDIQSIEVISNPGSRYDASVKSVINIKTVKKQGDGFSFNARSSFYAWENEDYINQINTNYRKGKVDLFVNAYYSNVTSYQKGKISQTVSVDTLWNQQNRMLSDMYINKMNATIGVNYQITDNHSLGLRYDLKSSIGENIQDLKMYSDITANGQSHARVYNNEYQRTKNYPKSQVNLYYNGKINKLILDFNSDFLTNKYETNSTNNEISKEFGNNSIASNSTINNTLSAAKLQLSYPLWKGDVVAGVEYVKIKRRDNYTNFSLSGFSSCVDLSESNLAFFTQYQLSSRIGNISVGLRYEDVVYDYLVDNTKDNDKSRKYGQWFPNASYSHRFGEVMIQLNYNSKVTRPLYNQLGTSLLYGNRFTLLSGNPYLKPSISNDVSLMGVWKFLQAQVSYTHQKDAITMWTERYKNDPKVSVITYRNLDKLPKLSAFVAASHQFEIWKPQLSVGIQKQWLDLAKYGVGQELNAPIYHVSLNNIVEFKNGYVIHLDGTYTSKGNHQTSYAYKDSFILGCGVSKNFFNDALHVKVAISDIFNQKIQAYQTYSPQIDMRTLFHYDTREASLTVRYYFNSVKSRYKGSGAGNDLIKRL